MKYTAAYQILSKNIRIYDFDHLNQKRYVLSSLFRMSVCLLAILHKSQ